MFGIRAAAAFDGERAVPGGALVLLDGGHLAGVEPGAAPAPDGCEVLEVPGGTVLPGLVDAHVHLCVDGTDGSLDRIQEPSEEGMLAVISQSLRTHLAAGVTTVRDLGDRRFAVLDWREWCSCVTTQRPNSSRSGTTFMSPLAESWVAGEVAGRDGHRHGGRGPRAWHPLCSMRRRSP